MTLPILVAAGLDWLEGLLPVLFVGFWILSQVMAVIRRVRGNGEVVAERRAAPKPRPMPVAKDEPPMLDRAELERQIAEFLREGGIGDRPQRQSPPARKSTTASSTPPRPPRVREVAPPTPASAPLSALERRGADVARHVHDAFAHELSHLESTLARGTAEQPAKRLAATRAAQFTEMLRDPRTIRNVILLREILERPVDRW